MGGDNGQKTVALTKDAQREAFEEAREQVSEDVQEGLVDADTWGGDVTEGDAIRLMAEAYTRGLNFNAE